MKLIDTASYAYSSLTPLGVAASDEVIVEMYEYQIPNSEDIRYHIFTTVNGNLVNALTNLTKDKADKQWAEIKEEEFMVNNDL
jgi:hypothetical protein